MSRQLAVDNVAAIGGRRVNSRGHRGIQETRYQGKGRGSSYSDLYERLAELAIPVVMANPGISVRQLQERIGERIPNVGTLEDAMSRRVITFSESRVGVDDSVRLWCGWDQWYERGGGR